MIHLKRAVRFCAAIAITLVPSRAISQSENSAAIEKYSAEGQRALASGDLAAAEAAYEKLRDLSPGTGEIHVNLGLIYYSERKYQSAVTELRRGLKLNPGLQRAHPLLGMSLSELGQYAEALPILEKEFRRATDAELKRGCGLHLERTYTGLRRDDKAVEIGLELARLYPNDPKVLYHNGRLFGNFAYLSIKHLSDVAPNSTWKHQASAEAYEKSKFVRICDRGISAGPGARSTSSGNSLLSWPIAACTRAAIESPGGRGRSGERVRRGTRCRSNKRECGLRIGRAAPQRRRDGGRGEIFSARGEILSGLRAGESRHGSGAGERRPRGGCTRVRSQGDCDESEQ